MPGTQVLTTRSFAVMTGLYTYPVNLGWVIDLGVQIYGSVCSEFCQLCQVSAFRVSDISH